MYSCTDYIRAKGEYSEIKPAWIHGYKKRGDRLPLVPRIEALRLLNS